MASWCCEQSPKTLKKLLQMPRSGVTERLNSQCNIHSACAIALCAQWWSKCGGIDVFHEMHCGTDTNIEITQGHFSVFFLNRNNVCECFTLFDTPH